MRPPCSSGTCRRAQLAECHTSHLQQGGQTHSQHWALPLQAPAFNLMLPWTSRSLCPYCFQHTGCLGHTKKDFKNPERKTICNNYCHLCNHKSCEESRGLESEASCSFWAQNRLPREAESAPLEIHCLWHIPEWHALGEKGGWTRWPPVIPSTHSVWFCDSFIWIMWSTYIYSVLHGSKHPFPYPYPFCKDESYQ